MTRAATVNLTFEQAHKVFSYNPATGLLLWKITVSQRAKAGMQCGSLDTNGYMRFKYLGKSILSHRLIWFLMTGHWPYPKCDHKNLNRSDNRWKNLRRATNSQNAINSKLYITNTSGYKGIYFLRRSNSWRATIKHDGKFVYLGQFKIKDHAIAARDAAVARLHGDFARPA